MSGTNDHEAPGADAPLARRLAHLDQLRDDGVLSRDEHEAARMAALAGTPASIRSKDGGEPTADPASSTGGRRGLLLTGTAIVLVVALVGLVAGVLLTSGSESPPAAAPTPEPASQSPSSSSPALTFHQSCTSDRVCPQITSLIGEDMGSKIQITLTYCDRTPGSYQGFVYRFALADSTGSELPWNTTQSATQSRACNTITADLNNNYSPGEYQVRASVSNTDTGQETTGQSDGFTIG